MTVPGTTRCVGGYAGRVVDPLPSGVTAIRKTEPSKPAAPVGLVSSTLTAVGNVVVVVVVDADGLAVVPHAVATAASPIPAKTTSRRCERRFVTFGYRY